jgi:hypothetical protein
VSLFKLLIRLLVCLPFFFTRHHLLGIIFISIFSSPPLSHVPGGAHENVSSVTRRRLPMGGEMDWYLLSGKESLCYAIEAVGFKRSKEIVMFRCMFV